MKKFAANFPAALRLPGRWLLVAGAGLLAGWSAPAQGNQLDVGVRSTVVDRPAGQTGLPSPGMHSRIYGIYSVQQVKSEQKLVKPVNEGMIMQILSEELNAHGFHLFAPGQKPDILLTVFYGRGMLSNPYLENGGRGETPSTAAGADGAGGAQLGGPTVSVTGMDTQLFKEAGPGFEAKLQKAEYEKLYIRVSAWAYPTDPKGKAKQLWNTTMVVDDPEHRDLNAVAQKMLEAGVTYFDREIKEEEADVYKPLPEGHVNVGTPEVVDPAAAKSK